MNDGLLILFTMTTLTSFLCALYWTIENLPRLWHKRTRKMASLALGAVWIVGSAVTLVTLFPDPSGAHWLGAIFILLYGAAFLPKCDEEC